jgi:DNA-binding CsgD family transcriptional regulator
MSDEKKAALDGGRPDSRILRQDSLQAADSQIWPALSQTPGIGVSITDEKGRLLFVNDTALALFSGDTQIEYQGKTIADFHPPEFVEERLLLIRQVLSENKPLSIRHIILGHPVASTVWPLRDSRPPFNRVIVVTRPGPATPVDGLMPDGIGTFQTRLIDLGPLNVLTRRELEVLVLLGHGMSVPRTASILHRSPKTVERHKDSIRRKLSLRGHVELVQLVTSIGLELSDVRLTRIS